MLFDINFAMRMNKQPKNFVLDKPKGTDYYIFIHFLTPAVVFQKEEYVRTKPNACILYAPKSRQYFSASDGMLIHSWIRFRCFDPNFFEARGIRVNEIFYPKNIGVFASVFTDIENNILSMPEDCGQKNEKMLFGLFENFGQERARGDSERLCEVQKSMRADPGAFSVARMADCCGFSQDHFTRLYKREFGISPRRDLMISKMQQAENMLLRTDIKVAQIAAECGYAGAEQFSRIFKKYFGIPPERYRLGETKAEKGV